MLRFGGDGGATERLEVGTDPRRHPPGQDEPRRLGRGHRRQPHGGLVGGGELLRENGLLRRSEGLEGLQFGLLGVVADSNDKRLPEVARACVAALGAQLRMLKTQVLEFDRRIMAWHRSNETSKRLDARPGAGHRPGRHRR